MLMFLSILFASLLVLAVCAAILTPAAPDRVVEPEMKIVIDPPKFFAGDIAQISGHAGIPVEVLLSQIERHVRLEQAAAERFLHVPSAESLHSPTSSPFVN